MARGGKRVGAGAPKGNKNALKHGGRAKVHYGVPLGKTLSSFEYRALCLEQLDSVKEFDLLNNHRLTDCFWGYYHRYKGVFKI